MTLAKLLKWTLLVMAVASLGSVFLAFRPGGSSHPEVRSFVSGLPAQETGSSLQEGANDMAQNQPKAERYAIKPEVLSSLEDARRSVSFVLQMPGNVPSAYRLESIKHFWPTWIPRSNSRPRADFLEVRFSDGSGHYLEITQGFFAKYHGVYQMVPGDAKGQVQVKGQDGIWVRAVPAPGLAIVDGRPQPASWSRDVTVVEWLTAKDEESGVYYSLASNALTLEQLLTTADTVAEFPG